MDVNFKSASLKKLMVHYVGSKNNLDPVYISPFALKLDEETMQVLSDAFLQKFNSIFEYHSFHHPSSLSFNEVYQYASQLFGDEELFEETSGKMARHLYESSTHPKVKGGELYVALFEGLPVESRMCSAVGLFKTENKALFLDVEQQGGKLSLQMKEGVELNKIDKGCLIINNKRDEGFDVLIFDNQNRGEEAQYWKEKFLNLVPQQNAYHHTQHLLSLTKQFVTEQLQSERELPKNEQIEMLHRSMDYFKAKESFDIEEFQQEVFGDEGTIEAFRNFGSRYTEHHNFDIASNFEISGQAVKKGLRVYKSVLKLDKNFHIYIHGNTDLIEKGQDDNGRKYYKIYYQEEA